MTTDRAGEDKTMKANEWTKQIEWKSFLIRKRISIYQQQQNHTFNER